MPVLKLPVWGCNLRNLTEAAADRDVGVYTAQQVVIDWTDRFDYQKLKEDEVEKYSSIEVTKDLHEGGIHAQKAWAYWFQYLAREIWKTSLAEETVSFCNTIANPRILSLGCGYGGIELEIAASLKKPYEIIAVDLNRSIFNRAEEEAGTKGFNIRFLSLDLNFVGIREGAFDLVLAHASLHHLLNLEHVFSQIYGGLRENGRLIVQDIIGKTQVLFWKENVDFAIDLVRNMPPRYKPDSFDKQSIIPPYVEPAIQKGMEGIRQEEIESQINTYFAPIKMLKYGSFIRLICTHPELGKRIGPSNEADRQYLETLFRLDLQQIEENKLRATEMLAVFEKRALADVNTINSEGRADLRACYPKQVDDENAAADSTGVLARGRDKSPIEEELDPLTAVVHWTDRQCVEMQEELAQELRKRDARIMQVQEEAGKARARLDLILGSRGWKMLVKYYRMRDLLKQMIRGLSLEPLAGKLHTAFTRERCERAIPSHLFQRIANYFCLQASNAVRTVKPGPRNQVDNNIPQKGGDKFKNWIDLPEHDVRPMLIALIGHDFGLEPEKRVPEIRESRKNYTNYIADKCQIDKKNIVIDLGSGCGFGTYWLAQRAKHVYACDISPSYIKFASKECSSLHNVSFHLIESRRLDFLEKDSIDVVCSISVFIHFNLYDIFWYFNEFKRVVKPGGRVWVDVADSESLDLAGPNRNGELFLRHAESYKESDSSLPGLMNWNSIESVINVAAHFGFENVYKKTGGELLFRASAPRAPLKRKPKRDNV
jgi:ubiquinone/menaquinone biosynthesis C-methylase UbiE